MLWTTMWYIFSGNVFLGQQSATLIDVMHCLDNNFTFRFAMLGLDNNVAYLLLSCLVWTTMWHIYCYHALFEQPCGIFTFHMLCLDNNLVYLLLPCLAWTTMLYIYCCHAWLGQQCCIFTVAMPGLDNNVVYLLLPCLVWTTM
jgi:hypothetical protein